MVGVHRLIQQQHIGGRQDCLPDSADHSPLSPLREIGYALDLRIHLPDSSSGWAGPGFDSRTLAAAELPTPPYRDGGATGFRIDPWERLVFFLPTPGAARPQGLSGTPLRRSAGLEELFGRYFPRSRTQRCQKHAKANACWRVRQREREGFPKDLNKVFHAARESPARAAFHEFKAKWGQVFPSAVAVIEKDFDALPRFFQFDPPTGPFCEPPTRLSV